MIIIPATVAYFLTDLLESFSEIIAIKVSDPFCIVYTSILLATISANRGHAFFKGTRKYAKGQFLIIQLYSRLAGYPASHGRKGVREGGEGGEGGGGGEGEREGRWEGKGGRRGRVGGEGGKGRREVGRGREGGGREGGEGGREGGGEGGRDLRSGPSLTASYTL